MDQDRDEKIRARAYEIWEEEGRPDGEHDAHWSRAAQHLGMMGDGTEEQNLNQPGVPEARITQAQVEEAFSTDGKTK